LSLAKSSPRIDIPLDVRELRVIKEIEEFGPELKIKSLRNMRVLQQSRVPVVDARSMKEAPPRITELTDCLLNDCARIEVRPLTRVTQTERRARDIRSINLQRYWPSKKGTQQGVVVRFDQR